MWSVFVNFGAELLTIVTLLQALSRRTLKNKPVNSGQRRPTSHCRVCEEFFLYFDFELPSLYIHVGFVSLFVCMFDRVHCENSDKAMGKPCFNG